MYYIWESSIKHTTKFFICHIYNLDIKMKMKIKFNMGESIRCELPVIEYVADNKLRPNDYPFTESGFYFLVSNRIASTLRKLEVEGIEYFESKIILQSGEILDNYFTLNIINVVECVDMIKSNFKTVRYGSKDYYNFKSIYLNTSKIPVNTKVFHLKEDIVSTIVHQSVKDELEKEGIEGVEFKPVELS